MSIQKILTLTDIQLAYLAGFIDGDGSIIAQIRNRPDYLLKFQISVSVLFIQKTTRHHFLMQFLSEIGVGTLRYRNDGISELALTGHAIVGPFLLRLRPFLRLKLKQANLILKIIEQLPQTKKDPVKLLEICQLVDQVSLLNDSRAATRIWTAQKVNDTLIKNNLIRIEE